MTHVAVERSIHTEQSSAQALESIVLNRRPSNNQTEAHEQQMTAL